MAIGQSWDPLRAGQQRQAESKSLLLMLLLLLFWNIVVCKHHYCQSSSINSFQLVVGWDVVGVAFIIIILILFIMPFACLHYHAHLSSSIVWERAHVSRSHWGRPRGGKTKLVVPGWNHHHHCFWLGLGEKQEVIIILPRVYFLLTSSILCAP